MKLHRSILDNVFVSNKENRKGSISSSKTGKTDRSISLFTFPKISYFVLCSNSARNTTVVGLANMDTWQILLGHIFFLVYLSLIKVSIQPIVLFFGRNLPLET